MDENLRFEIDVESNLRLYLPSLFELIGNNPFNWNKINKLYSAALHNRLAQLNPDNSNTVSYEPAFLDIVTLKIKGKREGILAVDMFNKLFEELIINLSDQEKKLILKTIEDLLINLNKAHKNFIGELLVLNQLSKNGFYLISTETSNETNKRTIDFKVISKEKQEYSIEVLNIHLKENKLGYTDLEIEKFITGRLNQKNSDKGYNEITNDFLLAPVVWGNYEDILKLAKYYRSNQNPIKNSFPMLYYALFTNKEDTAGHIFGTIDSIDFDKSYEDNLGLNK